MDTDFAQLWTNHAVSGETRSQLEADLRQVLNITQSRVMTQKSYGIPELIQIVLDAVEWISPLKAAAAFFIFHLGRFLSSFEKKLGEKAAETAWENREEIKEKLKETAAKPLGLVASAIARAKRSSSNQTYVRIGLPIPNDYFATLLSVDGDDEVSIAVTIAFFVLKAEEIEETIKRESREKGIAGGVKLHLEPGGSFVAQWDDEDFGYHEIRIE